MGVLIGHRVVRTLKRSNLNIYGPLKGSVSCGWFVYIFVVETAIMKDESIEIVIENIWGGVLFLTQAWVLLKWKFTQAHI